MALRLMLMGVVAGMGFSLPTQDDVTGWSRSAECWINARFDDWDAKMPVDDSAFVFAKDAVVPADAVPAQPIVSDKQFNAIVSEMAVTFAKETAPVVVGESKTLLVEGPVVTPTVETAPTAAPVAPAAVEVATTPVVETAQVDQAFASAMDKTIETFAAELVAPHVVKPTEETFTSVVEQMVADFTPTPLRVADVPAASAPAAEVQTEEEGRFAHAMRLTREAVFAWAGLLHGPAVVAISR